MKAVITKEYGSVNVLNIEEVDKPTIADDEILVEVKAASINPIDWRIRTGEMKIMTGKTPPRILGADYAGVVVEVGKNIIGYKNGDDVFGVINNVKVSDGSYAEFIKVKTNEINLKPKNCNYEEAASLPMVTLTSYLALSNIANVKPGSKVLVNGCTGGVGSAAVQIAQALGCKVTGICSGKNIDFAKGLGVDNVIDYKQEDVFEKTDYYDTIFDTVGNLAFSKSAKILNSGGMYVTTNVTISGMLLTPIANLFRSKKYKLVIAGPDSSILESVKQLVESDKVKSNVSKVFKLEEIKEAHELSEKGGFSGKLIVKI
jgi:NADPH:quinone reductase-like Zn-dependent oxidoreductase